VSPLRAALDRNLLRPLAALDGALLDALHQAIPRRETGLATRLMRALTHLGDFASWAVVCLALGAAGHGLGALLLALAVGIAVSRVYLGAHYPLDVAAGAVLGFGAGSAARALMGAGALAAPQLALVREGGHILLAVLGS
jgi:hypothetical protein